jgi:hypothetical protein
MKIKHLLTKVEWKKTVVSFVQGHDLDTTKKMCLHKRSSVRHRRKENANASWVKSDASFC